MQMNHAGVSPGMTELSFAEEQLWLADQPGPPSVSFVDCATSLSIVARLRNALDRRALEASLGEIVRRHDVLRSRFVVEHGRPLRLCEPWSHLRLTDIDLRGAPGDDRPALVRAALADDIERPFDLARGPLLRASLLALAGDEHILAITVHHIVFDRWSRRVLALELKQLYEAYAAGRLPNLPPLRAQYPDYVHWQRQRLDGDLGRALIAHWSRKLRDLSDLALPCDDDREQLLSTRSGTEWFTIRAADAARLRALSRRCRVTFATVMLALLTMFLYRVSGLDDIAVGVPVSDRRRPEFEGMIGLFTNVVVVRTTLTSGMTFLDLLDRVRGALVEACRYQDLPYGYLSRVLGAQRPLYRVLFNFMPGIPSSELALSDLRVEPVAIVTEKRALTDLSLHVREDGGALTCRLVYRAGLFSSTRVRHFAEQLQGLVTGVLDEPRNGVDTYDLTLAGERRESAVSDGLQ